MSGGGVIERPVHPRSQVRPAAWRSRSWWQLFIQRGFAAGLFLLSLIGPSLLAFGAPPDEFDEVPDQKSSAIIQRYLQAQQSHEDALRGASMKVEIDAAVPGLKERGRLSALRKISKVGQITYHVLTFQGDSSVKKDVIGRYLQAEQQGQGDQNIAITPENYKFRFRGLHTGGYGRPVFIFQVAPRKKKVGLFKGTVGIDAKSYLPVFEKGRLVKNPSIFVRKVEFERNFAVKDNVPIPQRMNLTLDVRLVGKVEITIDYSDFEQHGGEDADEPQSAILKADQGDGGSFEARIYSDHYR